MKKNNFVRGMTEYVKGGIMLGAGSAALGAMPYGGQMAGALGQSGGMYGAVGAGMMAGAALNMMKPYARKRRRR